MGAHNILRHHGSVSNLEQGCQCIKSNIKDRLSSVCTSDMVCSIGSYTKWGLRALGTHSLLERFTPALIHHSTSPTLMTRILTYLSETPHSTLHSSKLWRSWRILAHWLRLPNCAPRLHASQST